MCLSFKALRAERIKRSAMMQNDTNKTSSAQWTPMSNLTPSHTNNTSRTNSEIGVSIHENADDACSSSSSKEGYFDSDDIGIPESITFAAKEALEYRPVSFSENESRIDAIIRYVHAANVATCKNYKDAAYLNSYGKVLVIEEFDVTAILRDGNTGYRVNAGEYAGLNEGLARYRKRVHVYCDALEGAYFANNLGDNYHYHVREINLNVFLRDIVNQGSAIKIVGLNDCGKQDEAGVWTVDHPAQEKEDCIIYTSATPFVRSQSTSSDLKGNQWEDISFGCVSGRGMEELQDYTTKMHSDAIYNFLSRPGNGDNYGAEPRNHQSSIAFGYCAMNCTDRTKEGFHNLPSPKLTTAYDQVKSEVEGHDTMTTTLKIVMRNTTSLGDAICSVLRIPKQCDDDARNANYGENIIPGNRLEQITCAISKMDSPSSVKIQQSASSNIISSEDHDNTPFGAQRKRKKGNNNSHNVILPMDGGLACHTDSQNGRSRGYRGNVSYVRYFRNENEKDASKPDYFRRMHIGGYERRICETTHALKESLDDLLHQIDLFVIGLPLYQKKLDPTLVLSPHEDDQPTYYGQADIIARKPHCHKSVYYSLFVNELASWIVRRKSTKSEPDVDWPELLEAVMTAVRWTPSGSAWAQAFRSITNQSGVEILVPHDLSISDDIIKKYTVRTEKGRPVLAFKSSHESPLPLTLLYLCKIISTVGTVGGGGHGRFQAFCNLSSINMEDEQQSISQLMQLMDLLVIQTKVHEDKWEASIDTDDKLRHFAKEMWDVTEKFVTGAGKARDAGGVYGLGHLNAHHVIGILAHLGTISFAHYLNTNFSRHNGTYEFLRKHGVDVLRKRGQIINVFGDHLRNDVQVWDSTTNSICTRDGFDLVSNAVSENLICKVGSTSGALETVSLGANKFLSIIRDGELTASFGDGRSMAIVSGVQDETFSNRSCSPALDLTVARAGDGTHRTRRWWDDGNYLKLILHKNSFAASNRTVTTSERKRRERLKKHHQQTVQIRERTKTTMQVTTKRGAAEWKKQHLKKITPPTFRYAFCSRAKKELTSELRAYCIHIIQELFQLESFDRLQLIQKNTDYSVRNMTQKILLKCSESNDKLDALLKELENVSSFLYEDRPDAKKSPKNTLKAIDLIDSVKQQLQKESMKRTRYSLRSDDAYNPEDQSSSHLDYIQTSGGKQILFPTYEIINSLGEEYHQVLHLADEITKISQKTYHEVGELSLVKILHEGREFYNAQLIAGKEKFVSSDKAFYASPRSKKLMTINIGKYHLDGANNVWFGTKAHAELALYFVLCSKICVSIEQKFLSNQDFAVLFIHGSNPNNTNPICCITRVADGIMAVDLQRHRANNERNEASRQVTRTKLRNHVVSVGNINNKELIHTTLHVQTSNSEHDKRIISDSYTSFIEEANMYMIKHLPVNSSKVTRFVPNLPGWLKITILYGDKKNKKTGKRPIHYYYTPTYRFKLRSLESVQRFKKILASESKDEKAAIAIFKRQECNPT